MFIDTAGLRRKSKVEDQIEKYSVIRNNEIIEFTFEADGFLYNLVRIMVGTLLDINRGKIVPGSIPQIIESKDRNQAGATAAPEGLYLCLLYTSRCV